VAVAVEKPMPGQKRSRGGKQAMSNKRAKAAEQAPASQSSSAQHDVPEVRDSLTSFCAPLPCMAQHGLHTHTVLH